jgi:hypothetical protein
MDETAYVHDWAERFVIGELFANRRSSLFDMDIRPLYGKGRNPKLGPNEASLLLHDTLLFEYGAWGLLSRMGISTV